MGKIPAHAGKRGMCVLCELVDHTNKHHLVPRKLRKVGHRGKTITICYKCHVFVHATFTHRQLAEKYCTIRALRRHFVIRTWIKWRQKVGVTGYETNKNTS